ncbi:c-type cytochrome [Nitrospinota bacterium]
MRKLLKFWHFFWVLFFLGLLSPSFIFAHGGHKVEHNHPYPTKKFSVENGKKIYASYCASCHGMNGDGKGPAALSLKPRPTNFLDLKYMPMISRVDHYDAIANGRPKTAMAPWKNTLSDKEIWDVISYIEHLFNHQWNAK